MTNSYGWSALCTKSYNSKTYLLHKKRIFSDRNIEVKPNKMIKRNWEIFFLLLLEGSLPVAISFIPNTNFLACVLLTAAYNVYKYDLIHLAIKPL